MSDTTPPASASRQFLSGVQVLLQLPLLQQARDTAAGLRTGGFISGYRGSPLGGFDQALWRERDRLAASGIVFQPGINEDLAATAVWGTQQLDLAGQSAYDGVFALWYGKGPGVDRCGDVFRHANAAGSARHGGVLVVAGDDHAAKSSTLPHQTEHVFKAVMMPVLYPANLQEYVDFGLHGWAMSRFSGCWVAFKALADTVETSAVVDLDPARTPVVLPADFPLPPEGLNIRWPDPPLVQEARLLNEKLYAALAYARANRLDRVLLDSPAPRLGILTAGKSYLDVRQALDELGIDAELAAAIGIRLYKVGMVWPLEPEGVRHFAEGLEEILVVEEKRQLLEYQLKEELYNWRDDVRPRVIGKFDEKGEWALLPDGRGHLLHGDWLLPAAGELSVAGIARVIAARIGRYVTSPAIVARLRLLEARQAQATPVIPLAERKPHFCAGCPHNTSTRVPEGSRALAGIGCHYMVTWMDRRTSTFTHMGGEGVPWVGQAPFSREKHVFANLGDGTYFHSGLLAIRQALAAGVPITYKILFNGVVAMTGGQPVDGELDVPRLTRQLAAEGVRRIVVLSDDPSRHGSLPEVDGAPVPVLHRDRLDEVQRSLREYPGVSVLIYDQMCATEARRRRKRGRLPAAPEQVMINERVCEACGDCSVQSNCLAVVPVPTPFGTKRQIDASACNQDLSCLKGFCPSFVTVQGESRRPAGAHAAPVMGAKDVGAIGTEPMGKKACGTAASDSGTRGGGSAGELAGGAATALDAAEGRAVDAAAWPALPEPARPALARPYNLLLTGVGGTGVLTLGAIIGQAAEADGRGVSVLDMTGLAQKFGAVYSHVRIAACPEDIHAARIATAEADALLGGDLVVSAGSEAVLRLLPGKTRAVVDATPTPTADFTRQRDWQLPVERLCQRLREAVGEDAVTFIPARRLAEHFLGDAVFANLLLLGHAWQRGLVPVSLAGIDTAIARQGTAVEANRRAFLLGRRLAVWPERFTLPQAAPVAPAEEDLAACMRRWEDHLTAYQDAALAARYRHRVAAVAALGDADLARRVAEQYGRLLAPKDVYEVARLYTDGEFERQLAARFAGRPRLTYHFSPPGWPGRTPDGRPAKLRFGPWLRPVLLGLAALRRVRGQWYDPLRGLADHRQARAECASYEADIDLILAGRHTGAAALALAGWPAEVRGFGPVRAEAAARAQQQREAARAALLA